jgi:hypothetical protein
MAAITSSSETHGSLTRLIAIVAALIAFTDEIAFRSTQGIVPPANRIAGQSEMVLHGDFCGIQHLSN